MTKVINEGDVAVNHKAFEEGIKQHRALKKGLTSFSLSLSVVKPKTKNVFLNVDADVSRQMEDDASYDTFLSYLGNAYDGYAIPFYLQACKLGDLIQISAEVDEAGYFVDDICNLTVTVSIPNEAKANWAAYVGQKYRELFKFEDYITGFDFEVRDHKIQRVSIQFSFDMLEVTAQTVNEIWKNNTVSEDAIGLWFALGEEVAIKNAREKQHTHTIPAKKILTEFGPLFKVSGIETTKFKIE